MATFLSLTPAHVEYASRTKIKELAFEISQSYSLLKVKPQIQLASKMLRYLRVLQEDVSLTPEEETAIYQVLVKIGDLYRIPAAPTVTETQIVNILMGSQGSAGPQGPPGPPGAGFPYFTQFDVDSPSEVIDIVPVAECNAVRWDYYCIGGNVGEGRRAGSIIACWSDTEVGYYEHQGPDIGGITTPITFSVDLSGTNIRLLANVSTDDWLIRGARYQMQDLII